MAWLLRGHAVAVAAPAPSVAVPNQIRASGPPMIPMVQIDDTDFFDIEEATLTIPATLLAPVSAPQIPDSRGLGTADDFPIEVNKSVLDYISYFKTGNMRERFSTWLDRSGKYLAMVRDVLRQHNLPETLVFLPLIESGFNPMAYSPADASGIWQFIEGTAKVYGLRINHWVDERRDPEKSTVAAARYLKKLYGMFDSWPLSLASYNAGEGRILNALKRSNTSNFWDLSAFNILKAETRNYVPKFMAATLIARNPKAHGFSVDYQEPLRYDEVIVAGATSLKKSANAVGISVDELRRYNPELKRGITPPNDPNYRLKLPIGTKKRFLESYPHVVR